MSDDKKVRLSWSRHQVSQDCDLKYFLKYSAKAKKAPKNPGALLVGKAVHDAAEKWAKRNFPLKGLSELALEYFDKATAERKIKDNSKMRTRVAAAAFYTEQIYRELGVPQNGIIEYSVETGLSQDATLYGIVDLYMPNTKTIYDLKVSTAESSYKPDPGQLMMYALILTKKGMPINEVGFIYPLRPKTHIVTHPIEEGVLEQFEDQMRQSADKILSKDASIKPKANRGNHCYWCEYRESEFCPTSDILEVFQGRAKSAKTTGRSTKKRSPVKK